MSATKVKNNGRDRKTIKSSAGSVYIETSRDYRSSFDPQQIKRRETYVSEKRMSQLLTAGAL